MKDLIDIRRLLLMIGYLKAKTKTERTTYLRALSYKKTKTKKNKR